MDFTLSTYRTLLETLQKQGFSFLTVEELVKNPTNKVIVLRHDVDSLPANSLQFAKIQTEVGIKGSYYFRVVPAGFKENIIKKIYSLGHEVGYHYEDLGAIAQRRNGVMAEEVLVKIAIESFASNLEKLRKIVSVKTICMHGSPMSKWDSRLLWKYYDYHDFGIIGEPYFDINFDEVLYLTDTGRRWDGEAVSVRDRVQGSGYAKASADKAGLRAQPTLKLRLTNEGPVHRAQGKEYRSPITDHRLPFTKFHSTLDIITAAEEGRLPDKIMMTFHPQRWTDKPLPWFQELVWQNVKNVAKYYIVKLSRNR